MKITHLSALRCAMAIGLLVPHLASADSSVIVSLAERPRLALYAENVTIEGNPARSSPERSPIV